MTEIPRVTFGIIVLNGEPFTRYCLRALYPFAYEIIVVDNNGGVDRTREIMEHHLSSKIKLRFVREENKGLSYARNRGILESK